jgi:hypothetical protein
MINDAQRIDKLERELAFWKQIATTAYIELTGSEGIPFEEEVAGLLCTAAFNTRRTVLQHFTTCNLK